MIWAVSIGAWWTLSAITAIPERKRKRAVLPLKPISALVHGCELLTRCPSRLVPAWNNNDNTNKVVPPTRPRGYCSSRRCCPVARSGSDGPEVASYSWMKAAWSSRMRKRRSRWSRGVDARMVARGLRPIVGVHCGCKVAWCRVLSPAAFWWEGRRRRKKKTKRKTKESHADGCRAFYGAGHAISR